MMTQHLHLDMLVATAAEVRRDRGHLVPPLWVPLGSQILAYATLFSDADLRRLG